MSPTTPLPSPASEVSEVTQSEQDLIIELLRDVGGGIDLDAGNVEKILGSEGGRQELAAVLEDAGNRYLELSELLLATYARRRGLCAVK